MRKRFAGIALFLTGCSTMLTGEDAIPVLAPKLVGRHVSDLLAMYGQPSLTQVQQGHDVYYWERQTAFVYTPQYTATTQGTIGSTPYSSTTTINGDPQVGSSGCILVAGTRIGTDIVEKIDVRGLNCEAFVPRR